MTVKRSATVNSKVDVFDLRGMEFDRGFRGLKQRLRVVYPRAKHRLKRKTKSFLTSFVGMHVIYVTCLCLILSWILYPQRNMPYIDALFQATSAMSLSGLNTVPLNNLKTYQQIFLAVMPLLGHPMTTSLALVIYRLHLFRKKFDDIENLSKTQSKSRRALTYSQYEANKFRERNARMSFSNQATPGRNSDAEKDIPHPKYLKRLHSLFNSNHSVNDDSSNIDGSNVPEYGEGQQRKFSRREHPDNNFRGILENDNETHPDFQEEDYNPDADSERSLPVVAPSNKRRDPDTLSAASHENDSEAELPTYGSQVIESDTNDSQSSLHSSASIDSDKSNYSDQDEKPDPDDSAMPHEENKIRFGDLPRPKNKTSTKHDNHDPTEMFRSLNMMRRQNLHSDINEHDGPALVVKSPRDIEADAKRGIHSAVYDPNENVPDHITIRPYNMRRMSTLSNHSAVGNEGSYPSGANRMSRSHSMTANYLSYAPTVGRNSAFVNLTQEQKEELGGIEYRALRLLRYFIVAHSIITIVIGFIMILPWVYARHHYKDLIRSNGVSPVLFGMTTVLSGFTNNGLCVLPSSLALFWDTAYLPLVMCFVCLFGNSMIPLMLRFYIWITFQFSPRFGRTRESLGFLLDHPRRCFMFMFPRTTTWWLAFTLLGFSIVEIAFFMLLNRGSHNPVPYEHAGKRLLAAFVQSTMTRTTGFAIINLGTQHPAMLILNVVSMYLAIYPQAMTIRRSNVYESQSLGRYDKDTNDDKNGDDDTDDDDEDEKPSALVELLRRQLSLDIWSLVLALFFVTITEGGALERGRFTLFEIIFEIVSAHGTVGFSLGYKDVSVSGGFSTLGKLIMIVLMIRSRHRSMPYSIDRAVILRGKDITRRDKEQESRIKDTHVWLPRAATTNSRMSRINTPFTLRRRNTTIRSNNY